METQSKKMMQANTVGEYRVKAPLKITGLACDSREIRPGYLFAALPGSKNDGARFIGDAVRHGAVAILGRPELAPRVRELGVEFLADENPRLRLAQLAADFFGAQPSTVAAITGTNGKTSVAVFLRQLWALEGRKAASLGTIGLVTPSGQASLRHTTPDAIEIHRLLAQLKRAGLDYLAFEASSHGLDQYRIDGIDIAAAAFTNITRDHLDYHVTFEAYLAAKLRLFAEIVRDGGLAVINTDAAYADAFLASATERKLDVATIGTTGQTLRLLSSQPQETGQVLHIGYAGRVCQIFLPMVGGFQASNALVAAALALGLGSSEQSVFGGLEQLRGAPGRLERVALAASGAPVYVDYAHTPDALEAVLTAVRPHVQGRLHVIFGCGGDRDTGKRPLMGAVAAKLADVVIVTDDNPRMENPAVIRREVLAGCPHAREIGDRAEAICVGISELVRGDALIIAGKGHESSQIVGSERRLFSDRDKAIETAVALGGHAAEPEA